jgi:hypothetical protein
MIVRRFLVPPLLGILAALVATPAGADPPAPAAGSGTTAPTTEEVAALRREVEALRLLVRALQDQIATQSRQANLPAGGPTSTSAPGAAGAPTETTAAAPTPAPLTPAPPRSPTLLNPAISALFLLTGATSIKPLPDEEHFDLSEAEVALQAAVDPFARVDLYLAFPSGESPEVEEAVIATTDLPGPLQLRGGRIKSAFGKWNLYHNHQFFSIDRPPALKTLLGEESLTTDGLSLSVLIPNPAGLYIDAVTEVGAATHGPAFNSGQRSLTFLEHLTVFLEPGRDHTLEIGATGIFGETGPSTGLTTAIDAAMLTGVLTPADGLDSQAYGFDVTWKWRPADRNVHRSFLWQTEFLRSRRDVETLDLAGPSLVQATATSDGGYAYAEYQFLKRWRAGARFDWTGFPDDPLARERAVSGVVRFQPSEFQELRFQIERVSRNDAAAALAGGDEDETRLFFQWIPIIGAHGAHKY